MFHAIGTYLSTETNQGDAMISALLQWIQYFHNTHKAQNKFDLPGIYKLNSSNCNKFYIDQTGRSFKQRHIEHTKALHTTTESTFANHLIEANHTYKNIDSNMNLSLIHILEPFAYSKLYLNVRFEPSSF